MSAHGYALHSVCPQPSFLPFFLPSFLPFLFSWLRLGKKCMSSASMSETIGNLFEYAVLSNSIIHLIFFKAFTFYVL